MCTGMSQGLTGTTQNASEKGIVNTKDGKYLWHDSIWKDHDDVWIWCFAEAYLG